MKREEIAYNDWKQERDRTIDFLKSRRTQDGGIIADDFAKQALRVLYRRPVETSSYKASDSPLLEGTILVVLAIMSCIGLAIFL